MIDPEKMQLAARLAAIEYLLTKMFAFLTYQATDKQFEELLQSYRAGLEKETIPGLDAALAELAMSEVRDEVLRLLSAVREIRTKGL